MNTDANGDADASSAPLDRFRAAAERHAADVVTTTPASFATDLTALVESPAVGAPLPFDDPALALPDAVPVAQTPADAAGAHTGVTGATLGIADYGTVVLAADADGTEPVSLLPERHVAVVRAADVVGGTADALAHLGPRLRDERGSAVLATGPSATADMGSLVYGAHGPREVTVLVVRDGSGGRGEGTRPDGDAGDEG
ncbi:MAG: LUD domain-containing protein [Haloferacaceae archaeon]